MAYFHIPVMLKQAMEYLNPRRGEKYIDCTLGGAGYTAAILKRLGKNGLVIAFDLDMKAINNAKEKLKKSLVNKNLILINDNFKNLSAIAEKYYKKLQNDGFAGIVFDLGLSSDQLANRNRGFSFQLDAPLDMNFSSGPANSELRNTAEIVNKYKQIDLENIIREYGEEKYAKHIAGEIVKARQKKAIKTTKELVEIIRLGVPAAGRHGKIHFATKTFQALRIETNQELENLRIALPQALALLKSGGRMVIISYHSLEDRIVKRFFKRESRGCICPPQAPVCVCGHKPGLKFVTRKIITPTKEEIKINPRSRSAKMRVAEKI